MSRYPEFDLSTITPQAFAERESKVRVQDFATPPRAGASFLDFLSSFPKILAGPQIAEIARSVDVARRQNRAAIWSIGGHVIKTGLAPVLNSLMEQGHVTALAANGAVAIHDCELALFGSTSEDVVHGLKTGTFGMSGETAAFYNDSIRDGARLQLGIGESLGKALVERGAQYNNASVLASAYRLGIPFSVHIGIGTDIVHMHPNADGAAVGEGSLRDFRILTESMRGLAGGGVLLNIGSAVVLPEVLLKSIAILRNQDPEGFTDFLGVNLDFIQQYRSNQQVVTRVQAIGGRGIALTGHHEILVPLLAQAIMEFGAESAPSANSDG